MSNRIDENVVEMKLDNAEFLRRIGPTLKALEQLTKSLQLDHVAKGISASFGTIRKDMRIDDSARGVESSAGKISTALQSIRKVLHLGDSTKDLKSIPGSIARATEAGSRFTLAPMLTSISGVTQQFGAMRVAGVTAIATIVSRAVSGATQFTKQFTTTPIKAGLQEYETNLNAIQTILANTGLEGAKGLLKVNEALNELNTYSDKTIYNFSEMARNIGTFTAAGVKLDVATDAIKGIANLAAVSGSSAAQASTAMYQLSQALATGTVKLMDWNSIVNAGMGGKVFQEALKETARVHGVAVDKVIKKEGSFRDSLQTGWLTSKILTETLAKFTGDLSEKQLKQMGYSEKQIKQIIKQGKMATDAATKVKTFTQLVDTLKEAAGSGWAKTWQLILGDFDQAKDVFTGLNNTLGTAISNSANARNKVLSDWNRLGGRFVLIEGIADGFRALLSVIKPIRAAFREIFPAQTGKSLLELTKSFRDFTKHLIIGKQTVDLIKRTFAGVFAVFDIVRQVVSGLRDSFSGFFGVIGENSHTLLELTARLGDWLVALDKTLKKNGDIKKFFDDVKNAIQVPIRFLGGLADSIAHLFDAFQSDDILKFTAALDVVQKRLSPLETLARGLGHLFRGLGHILGKVGDYIEDRLGGIGHAIASAFTSDNFNTALDTLNTGFLAAIVLMLRNFFRKGFKVDFGRGLVDKIKDALDGVTGTLRAMQTDIKANALLKIAAALALLTASVVVLATVDSGKLTKSLAALSYGLAGISLVMLQLSRGIDAKGTAKLVFISGAMVAISTALIGLSTAVKIMSTIEPNLMYQGLIGLGTGLAIISKVMQTMPRGMILQAVALNGIATSLVILAGALKLFGTISWDEMIRGLSALGGTLVIIAGAMHLMPKNMVLQAGALTILAGALNVIGLAMKLFATISWDEMLHGLIGIGGVLGVIAGAMRLMPRNMLRQSAALIAVAGALNVIGLAIMGMGSMSWKKIAKGLTALGGSLLILAAALHLMNGTLLGSAALLVAAGALAVLTPVLIALGHLSWSTLLHGLAALAGIFVILGVAGLVLAPLVPAIIGLAAAVTLVGAGLALAGLGALAFSAALTAITIAGDASISVLADILATFIDSIPTALAAFGLGLVKLAEAISKGAPQFTAAMVSVLESVITAVIDETPRLGEAFITLVKTALKVFVELTPSIAAAGLRMIVEFLKAIDRNIYRITGLVISIVAKFLTGVADNLHKIIDAGFDLIISFINGMAKAIEDRSEELGKAGYNLAMSIVKGMIKGLLAGVGMVEKGVLENTSSIIDAAKKGLDAHSPSREFEKIANYANLGMVNGFVGGRESVLSEVRETGTSIVLAMRKTLEGLSGITDGMDVRPTISPVLDLSDVIKKVKQIDGIIPKHVITLDATYSSARKASTGYETNRQSGSDDVPPSATPMPVAPPITFIQHNTSPKALSEADIYRNTKSQLSQAKEVISRNAYQR